MLETQTRGTERRRSHRVLLAAPIIIESLDSLVFFSGRCNTVDVSFHGCQFFISRPFRRGVQLRLDIPHTQHTAIAHVVRSMPAAPDMKVMLWKVGVELAHPGNFWGVESPPDWVL
ncbi:MAG: PilZ domain-containing protein [Nitrospirae bacterium]|nr:MAG: PilZ domain-containing protein [Nitrospirota bacterium]